MPDCCSGVLALCAQTDSWVQSKGLDPYYSLFTERINTLVAGAKMTPSYQRTLCCDNVALRVACLGLQTIPPATQHCMPEQHSQCQRPLPWPLYCHSH